MFGDVLLVSGFIPQSFIDWKGKVVAIIFTPGCTLRCGYCHNPELLGNNPPSIDVDNVISKIKDLSWALDGVVITGGEPTMQDELVEFCATLHSLGLKVKLDTNGTLPNKLRAILPYVDYVAMDAKTPTPSDAMRESMAIVVGSGIAHEFRTTWDPRLSKDDVLTIAKMIPTTWVLQEFRPIKCLDPIYETYPSTRYELLKSTAVLALGPSHVSIRSELHGEESIR